MFSERRNLEKYLGDTTAFRELGSYIESYKTVRVGFSARLRHVHLHQQKILIFIESIELCYPSVFLESGSAHLGVPISCLMRQITLWTPVIALTNSHQLWDIQLICKTCMLAFNTSVLKSKLNPFFIIKIIVYNYKLGLVVYLLYIVSLQQFHYSIGNEV